MNKKTLFQFFAILAFFISFSCTKDNMEKTNNQQQSSTITITKEHLSNFFVSYNTGNENVLRSTSTTDFANDREEAIIKLMDKFIPYIISKIDRKKNEFASFILKNDKEKGSIEVENVTIYMPEKMNPEELAWFLTFTPNAKNTQTRATESEQLEVSCEGGENDGKSITVDRPTGVKSGYKFAKEVAGFSADCIDGGGCVKICKVEMTVS